MDIHRIKIKEQQRFLANGNQKRSVVTMLLSNRIDFRSKTIILKKNHLILINRSIHQNHIIILNIHTHNRRTSNYIKWKLTKLQLETDKATRTKTSREKISKDIGNLNIIINQLA